MPITPASLGRTVGAALPLANVQQLRADRLWLTERGEPFAEIDIHEGGARADVCLSPDCGAQYAAIVVCCLYGAGCSQVGVYPHTFILTETGAVLYGADADTYYRYLLLTSTLRLATLARPDAYLT